MDNVIIKASELLEELLKSKTLKANFKTKPLF